MRQDPALKRDLKSGNRSTTYPLASAPQRVQAVESDDDGPNGPERRSPVAYRLALDPRDKGEPPPNDKPRCAFLNVMSQATGCASGRAALA